MAFLVQVTVPISKAAGAAESPLTPRRDWAEGLVPPEGTLNSAWRCLALVCLPGQTDRQPAC